jgi:hypothetical protein
MDELACFHDDARTLFAWGRVDLVLGIGLKPRDRQVLGGRSVCALCVPPSLIASSTAAATPAAPSGRGIVLGGFLSRGAALLSGLLLEQSLPVSDRDLVIVGMNFCEGQKPWRFPP